MLYDIPTHQDNKAAKDGVGDVWCINSELEHMLSG